MAVTVTVNAETAEALSKLQEFFKKGTEGFGEVVRAGDFLREMGGRIAAAFSIGAIVEFTREAINAAEGLKILSIEGGYTVRFLSNIKEGADKTRDGFGGMTLALTHFSQALGMAIRQGGASAQGFRDLIGTEGLAGFATGATNIDNVLRNTVDAFNKLPDGPKKAALAMDLFGRSGREVLPVLEKMKRELEQGLITPQMADDASEFNTTLRELKSSFENIFIALAQELLPALREFVDFLKQYKDELGLLAAVIRDIGFQFRVLVVGIELATLAGVEMAKGWIDAFQTAKKVLDDLVASAVKGAEVIGKAGSGNILGALKAYAEFNRNRGDAGKDVAGFIQRSGQRGGNLLTQANEIMQRLFGKPAEAGTPNPEGAARGDVRATAPGGTGTVPLSVEAENIIRDVNKAFEEATGGRIEALNAETMVLLKKAKEEIHNEEKKQETLTEIRATYAKKRTEIEQQQADAEREIQLAAVQGSRHLVQSDPFRTEAEKKGAILASLAKENALLKENIELMERRIRDGALTPEAHLSASKQLQDLQQKQADNAMETVKVGAQGTLSGEWKKMLTEMGDDWGSWAKQISVTFKDVVGSAISSISQGITGLIEGTMTWAQALRQIGSSLLSTIISGIVKMFAEWILGRQTASAVELATSTAENVPKAIGALFTSITSYGAAAAIGAAALVAALGVGIAAAAGAFAEGGRPPVGQLALVGERGPELWVPDHSGTVIPADATRSILSGGTNRTGGNGGNRGGGGGTNLNLWFVNREDQIPIWQRSRENEDHIVDVVNRNHHRLKS